MNVSLDCCLCNFTAQFEIDLELHINVNHSDIFQLSMDPQQEVIMDPQTNQQTTTNQTLQTDQVPNIYIIII